MSIRTRIALSIYSALVVMILGAPFMVELVNGKWLIALSIGLLIFLLVGTPYLILGGRMKEKE